MADATLSSNKRLQAISARWAVHDSSYGHSDITTLLVEIERLTREVERLKTYPPMLYDGKTGTITPLQQPVHDAACASYNTPAFTAVQTPCDCSLSEKTAACTCNAANEPEGKGHHASYCPLACQHDWTIQVQKKNWAIYCCEKCGMFTRRTLPAEETPATPGLKPHPVDPSPDTDGFGGSNRSNDGKWHG